MLKTASLLDRHMVDNMGPLVAAQTKNTQKVLDVKDRLECTLKNGGTPEEFEDIQETCLKLYKAQEENGGLISLRRELMVYLSEIDKALDVAENNGRILADIGMKAFRAKHADKKTRA